MERGDIFLDMDRRNTGTRLVRFDRFEGHHAVCTILTDGGRPCYATDKPELIGTGLVGQETRISLDRLSKPYRFLLVAKEV